MVDLEWLLEQYPNTCRQKPMLVVTGATGVDPVALREAATRHPAVKLAFARLPISYGTHHTLVVMLMHLFW